MGLYLSCRKGVKDCNLEDIGVALKNEMRTITES